MAGSFSVGNLGNLSNISSPGVMMTSEESLEHAASMIDHFLIADRNYLDLSELLQVPSHSKITYKYFMFSVSVIVITLPIAE